LREGWKRRKEEKAWRRRLEARVLREMCKGFSTAARLGGETARDGDEMAQVKEELCRATAEISRLRSERDKLTSKNEELSKELGKKELEKVHAASNRLFAEAKVKVLSPEEWSSRWKDEARDQGITVKKGARTVPCPPKAQELMDKFVAELKKLPNTNLTTLVSYLHFELDGLGIHVMEGEDQGKDFSFLKGYRRTYQVYLVTPNGCGEEWTKKIHVIVWYPEADEE